MVSLEGGWDTTSFETGRKEGAKSCCMHELICRISGGKSKEF